jgi:hypothetical protein
MQARADDTDPDAESVQLELLRRAGPARRLRMALSLSAHVIDLALQGIRRASPGISEREAQLRFVELHYGRELGRELRAFLDAQRP